MNAVPLHIINPVLDKRMRELGRRSAAYREKHGEPDEIWIDREWAQIERDIPERDN